MTNEDLQQYLNNNKLISSMLQENENLIRKAGYDPPCNNYAADKEKRVNIPSGYIRTSREFWQKYHLSDIVKNRNTKNNISYALQLSDYYNYVLNRFNIWGSIEIMIYKQAFINVVSIIEALLLESATRINHYCQSCRRIGKCKNNFSRLDRTNMKKVSEKFYLAGVLDLTESEISRLKEMYDYRNKIHIRLNEQNEFLDSKYNVELYNEATSLLQKIDECLWKNAVPFYRKCIGFEQK